MATDAISRRYALLNKQLQQSENRNLQTEQDALSRRFASIGGLGSGASIKAGQISNQASARRVQEGKTALAASEADERFKQEEIEKGRAFQTSERLGSQEYASGEASEQRKFLTGERLGSQTYATGEREESQKFTAGENSLSRRLQEAGLMGYMTGDDGKQIETQSAKDSRLGRELTVSENALSRRLQEAGLMGYVTDDKGNQIETQAAKDARLGREQFDKQLAQQGELARKDIDSREKVAQWQTGIQNKAFEADRDFKNANLAWEKAVFQMEFPINKQIAFENLKTAKEASKSEIGQAWNVFTRDPIVKTGDWLSDRLGLKI